MIDGHIPCGYLMSTVWTFDGIGNKKNVYRDEDCMKKFCESIRKHAMKIINFEKKKMIPLTNEQQEAHENTTVCYICKKTSKVNILMIKNIK